MRSYLYLIKEVKDNHIIVADKIMVNQIFLNCFDIDFSSTAFFTHFDMPNEFPKVSDIISHVESRLNYEAKCKTKFRFKYQIEPRKFAKKIFLPKVKKWDADMLIDLR